MSLFFLEFSKILPLLQQFFRRLCFIDLIDLPCSKKLKLCLQKAKRGVSLYQKGEGESLAEFFERILQITVCYCFVMYPSKSSTSLLYSSTTMRTGPPVHV